MLASYTVEVWDKEAVSILFPLAETGDLDEAKRAFERASDDYPDLPVTLRNRAMVVRRNDASEAATLRRIDRESLLPRPEWTWKKGKGRVFTHRR